MSQDMKKLKAYTISYIGLKVGKHHFEYQIDNTFFKDLDFDEFNAADVKVDLILEKKSTFLELDFKAEGVVNINCDLSNEPYNQPIEDDFKLVVKFGDSFNNDNEEILILPHGEYELNVAQYIYELIVLALPYKRVHPGIEDGTLKSEILEKLEELSPKINQEKEKESKTNDPRWDKLKKLLTDK
jgi:uncharacterized metal-binding protein YceD (DUF177 family)